MVPLIADTPESRKTLGSFYTPRNVAETLVRWVVRSPTDRLLDPACGDGRFLAAHQNSVGVDRDISAVIAVTRAIPSTTVHAAEFFEWADNTNARFDCVAGNPPFIRYQQFNGEMRKTALRLCQQRGVKLTGLSSSWAAFVVVGASLLKQGGNLAFVVPAEIGHAPYAQPVLRFLLDSFADVQVIAVREKVFPELSEDVWFVHARAYGESTDSIQFSAHDSFQDIPEPFSSGLSIKREDLERWNHRLRPFLVPPTVRDLYLRLGAADGTIRLRECSRVGIGYVTGSNGFFHLRPSDADELKIPKEFLAPTVRRSGFLPEKAVTRRTVESWIDRDEPVLLLRIPADAEIPANVRQYLDSPAGVVARTAYKCRVRSPWYSVPDVRIPDAFLGYMSGLGPNLVANHAGCVCTNSIHAIHLTNGMSATELVHRWSHPLVALSCELEGHPLGGGMLKLEPREAGSVHLPARNSSLSRNDRRLIDTGVSVLRRWRHYA